MTIYNSYEDSQLWEEDLAPIAAFYDVEIDDVTDQMIFNYKDDLAQYYAERFED